MTRVSEDMYETGEYVTVPCFHCGKTTARGGRWLGVGQEVVVCRNKECVRSAMHLVYDAIHDVTDDFGATRAELTQLTKQVLSDKERDL